MTRLPALHIGYPKTATTTLQDALFLRHSQIVALGKPWRDEDETDWLVQFHLTDSLEFDAARAREGYVRHLASRGDDGKAIVVSVELFTLPHHADRGLIARRLREAIGPATILVCIREQLDYLPSLYRQQLGKHATPASFQAWLEASWHDQVHGYLHFLEYHKLVRLYRDLFGAEHVHVLLFEELKADQDAFARRVCRAIAVDPEEGARLLHGQHIHPGRSAREIAYNMLRRRLLPGARLRAIAPPPLRAAFLRVLRGGPKYRIEIPPALVGPLRARYRAGNRVLLEDFGVPVDRYGYAL
ncbi:MAG: sulfotransferase domain-containing protein [Alphaproteobacteria bacterium]|nr:sulfotransferase domain-containing protein [Alphaproteobacteria bacterium]